MTIAIETKQDPLVSIGMFVYNEARFIRHSLAALLSQDYPNLEIIISDNCSTDDTAAICSELTKNDSRVRLINQLSNIGAANNSVLVLNEARGKYFMWASGHDLWSSNSVSECVKALEAYPTAAIAYAQSSWVDADGAPIGKRVAEYDTRGLDPISRFFTVYWGNLHPVLGVFRMQYLKEVRRIFSCVGSDQLLLAELSLRGDFIHVKSAIWWRREFRNEKSYSQKLSRYSGNEFKLTDNWIDRTFPLLRLPIEIVKVILRSSLLPIEKFAVLISMPGNFAARYLAGKQR
jgi:glycosyltransferase involved in cell wall biosynthesis